MVSGPIDSRLKDLILQKGHYDSVCLCHFLCWKSVESVKTWTFTFLLTCCPFCASGAWGDVAVNFWPSFSHAFAIQTWQYNSESTGLGQHWLSCHLSLLQSEDFFSRAPFMNECGLGSSVATVADKMEVPLLGDWSLQVVPPLYYIGSRLIRNIRSFMEMRLMSPALCERSVKVTVLFLELLSAMETPICCHCWTHLSP